MGPESLVGTWKLLVLELRRSDGELHNPVGAHPIGQLIYDGAGHFSSQMMRPHRPFFASGDQLAGTPEEVRATVEGYVAYSGTWEVDEARTTITQHVECSLFPNWVGTKQKRFYKLAGNRLFVSTPTISVGGVLVTALVVWEKVT